MQRQCPTLGRTCSSLTRSSIQGRGTPTHVTTVHQVRPRTDVVLRCAGGRGLHRRGISGYAPRAELEQRGCRAIPNRACARGGAEPTEWLGRRGVWKGPSLRDAQGDMGVGEHDMRGTEVRRGASFWCACSLAVVSAMTSQATSSWVEFHGIQLWLRMASQLCVASPWAGRNDLQLRVSAQQSMLGECFFLFLDCVAGSSLPVQLITDADDARRHERASNDTGAMVMVLAIR